MPNVWGNPDVDQKDQDMVSDPNNHNVLQVNTDNGAGGGADKIAIHAINLNADADARGLKVEGKSELGGVTTISDLTAISSTEEDEPTLTVENGSGDADPTAIKVTVGKVDVGLSGVLCEGTLQLGSRQTSGTIEGFPTPNPGALQIGIGANTGTIYVGRNGQTLRINSEVEIGADEDDPALLDAALDDADPRNLNIGTQASTGNVFMGRNGQFVTVNGSLAVGPTNSNGVIDSGGTPAAIQHLKIGTGTGTKDVILGRATRTVDMMAQARMNSNGIVMNGASSVTDAAGIGFVVNAVGHGNGASIDFYINGVVEGWLDATGFVNA